MHRRLRLLLLVVSLLLLLACRAGPFGGEELATPANEVQGPAAVPSTPSPSPGVAAEPAETPTSVPDPTATPTPTVTPTPATVEGRVVIWHSWSLAEGDALLQILTAAREAYPQLQVDTLFVAMDDIPQAYADAVAAGGGPDLLLAPDWWLSDLQMAGALAPIDDLISVEAMAEYWPAALQGLTDDSRLYGLPTSFELVSLYYNRALVDSAQLPQTTEDLIRLAETDPRLGSGLYASLFHLYWAIPAYGGTLFDPDHRVVLDGSDGAAQFLIWLRRAAQTPGIYVDQDYGMLLDRFKKGEFAFLVDGPWAAAELTQALGDDLGVTPLPAGPAGPAQPWLSVDGVFVNPNLDPDQKWRAVALARFLTRAESAAILAQVADRLPAARTAQVGSDPVRQGFAAQAATAVSLPAVPEMEAVWGYGGDMILKVVYGGADPTQTVLETVTLINEANGK